MGAILYYIGIWILWEHRFEVDRFLRRIPIGVGLDEYLKVLEAKDHGKRAS